MGLLVVLMIPVRLPAIEILEADAGLSIRLTGPPDTEAQFGNDKLSGLRHDDYLLGSFYTRSSYEVALVFGFRLTEEFLREWEHQGHAELLFSIIEFHEGDAGKICPISLARLGNADSAEEAANRPAEEQIGLIQRDDLDENRLYRFPLDYRPGLIAGDIVWLGLDSTNPQDQENHNLVISGDLISRPGGTPPILITGTSDATSQTVLGMSLLQSLNRRYSAPETKERLPHHETTTPRFINPLHTQTKLSALGALHVTLERELAKLPEQPVSLSERYRGFHSSIKPENESWKLCFPVNGKESSIAFYPAVQWNGKHAEPYAFPKRFIITAFPLTGEEPVIVADWSQTDFPHNSLTPVIFPFRWQNYKEIEINVLKGVPQKEGHAFALAEVVFSRIAYNTDPVRLRCAPMESQEDAPFWSADYITDGITPFGIPRRSNTEAGGTFHAFQEDTNAIQLVVRSPRSTTWGSFEFFPAGNQTGLSPDGFPRDIKIEFSNQDDFSTILLTVNAPAPIRIPNADQPLALRIPQINARCIRFTFDPLPETAEGRLLELEEITCNGGQPFPWNQTIELCGASSNSSAEPLFDWTINGRTWNTPLRRTINLIRRHVLADELQRTEYTIQSLRQARERTLNVIKTSSIVLATTLFGLILFFQRYQARKGQLRIRHRIQQDLHDEIGSKLSVISMITERCKNATEYSDANRSLLTNANHCARTAIASLTEVIWLTDKEILTLDQCFGVMKNRAEKMVHGINLEIDFPPNVPPLKLSYQTKRNLILLFTEALNNALKHSKANTVAIRAELDKNRKLTLCVHDDGTGFSPESAHESIGLRSNAYACPQAWRETGNHQRPRQRNHGPL